VTGEETRARAEALLPAFARSRVRCGEYKPVPEDLLDVVERLVDAAEDVVAWYAVMEGDMDNRDVREAMARLRDVIVRTSTYLGGNS
jgi:hypothetical protein